MEKELNASRQNSLSTYVFKKLREGIISGKYKENDELRELAIGNELGVSRTPVREALRQLELEGLVNIVPNKGAYVIGISTKDIHDIYEMRSLLEGLCAKKATKIITDEQISELESILDLSERVKTIQNIELKDIREHYRRTHTAKNMLFVIAGKIKGRKRKIMKMLNEWV